MQVRARVDRGSGEAMIQNSGQIIMSQFNPEANTTAGASTLTVSSLLSGLILRSGAGAGFNDTLPTVNALIQGAPFLSVGDSFSLLIQNASGFTLTLVAGTGWTLVGTTTVVTVNTREYLVTILSNLPTRILTGAATVNGSPIVTGLTDGDCRNVMPGMLVSGTGIPGATTILAVNADTNTIVLSANATATNNPIALTCDPTATIQGVRTSPQ